MIEIGIVIFYPGKESRTKIKTDTGIIVDDIQNLPARTQDPG
nr:hypothetical protein [Methanospirillum lacunae]